jgi:hypothetical protein
MDKPEFELENERWEVDVLKGKICLRPDLIGHLNDTLKLDETIIYAW